MTTTLSSILNWAFPTLCLMCRTPAYLESNQLCEICDFCFQHLPWLHDRCYRCGEKLKTETEAILCSACTTHPPFFDRVCALLSYEPPLTQLISQLKFNNNLAVGRIFGELLAQTVKTKWYPNHHPFPEVLMPVPLHVNRLKTRGYNQSSEIMWAMQKILQLPSLELSMERVRHTKAQSGLNKQRRQHNVRNVFQITNPIPYKHIALVDDVVTTGSTVNELCKVLKNAGAETVDVWCVCRA